MTMPPSAIGCLMLAVKRVDIATATQPSLPKHSACANLSQLLQLPHGPNLYTPMRLQLHANGPATYTSAQLPGVVPPCMLAVMTDRTALLVQVINGAIVVATAASIAFLWWS